MDPSVVKIIENKKGRNKNKTYRNDNAKVLICN